VVDISRGKVPTRRGHADSISADRRQSRGHRPRPTDRRRSSAWRTSAKKVSARHDPHPSAGADLTGPACAAGRAGRHGAGHIPSRAPTAKRRAAAPPPGPAARVRWPASERRKSSSPCPRWARSILDAQSRSSCRRRLRPCPRDRRAELLPPNRAKLPPDIGRVHAADAELRPQQSGYLSQPRASRLRSTL
jgi:hypothetical protein